MPETCTVTGTVIAPDGSIVPNAIVRFRRFPAEVFPVGTRSAVHREVTTQADADGGISVELVPGAYDVTITVGTKLNFAAFRIGVPDAPHAILAQIQEMPPPPTLDAAEQAVLAAENARDEANASMVAAGQSAQAAADSAAAAAGSEAGVAADRERAETAAEGAEGSEQAAAGSAVAAGESATLADQRAGDAEQARDEAQAAEVAAKAARDSASGHRLNAQNAQAAAEAAQEASEAAQEASETAVGQAGAAADAAAISAGSAGSSAGDAAASATVADTRAGDAEAARDAAQAAQTGAEEARGGAEAAQGVAETAAGNAAGSATAAAGSATAAEGHATEAGQAKEGAEAAQTAAVAAKEDAEAAAAALPAHVRGVEAIAGRKHDLILYDTFQRADADQGGISDSVHEWVDERTLLQSGNVSWVSDPDRTQFLRINNNRLFPSGGAGNNKSAFGYIADGRIAEAGREVVVRIAGRAGNSNAGAIVRGVDVETFLGFDVFNNNRFLRLFYRVNGVTTSLATVSNTDFTGRLNAFDLTCRFKRFSNRLLMNYRIVSADLTLQGIHELMGDAFEALKDGDKVGVLNFSGGHIRLSRISVENAELSL